MKINFKRCANSFQGRIVLMVMLGIFLIAVTVSTVVLAMSQDAFTETYGKSQEKVFEQVEKELNDLHESLQDMINAIDSSWAFRLYLNGQESLDNVQTFQNIYQMEKDLEQKKPLDIERPNILVVGMNGKHYLSRTEIISMSDENILDSEIVRLAMVEPERMHYTFSHGAFTTTAMDSDVVIVSKALYFQESREIYAVVLITLTMDDLRRYYDYFTTDYTSLYLVDGQGIVICSDDRKAVGAELEAQWYRQAGNTQESRFVTHADGRNYTVMQRELSYLGCSLYGITDNNLALAQLYNRPLLVMLCVGTGILVLTVCLIFTRQTIRPLSKLVQKMSMIRNGNFAEYMVVEGTHEVRELADTYNYMLDDIKNYIEELLKTQKEQRKSEIKALQMQINPHYIYNTLASIKWLVYQNDTEKTIQVIDAFISLLRNTISNADEFITISQEEENLKNYILINHTRYGEAVKVEFYVSQACRDCLIPKMILQPFIENSFFHAFPSGKTGLIQILMRQKGEDLEICVEDNGIGMAQDKAEQIVRQETKKEHFSGIGIHNVQDRLRLLYGGDYGIRIESMEQEGTKVVITLPVRKRESAQTETE